MIDYETFLVNKSQVGSTLGFDPIWLPSFLIDFQRSLVDWSVRKGRSAIFAGCGLGKTPMYFTWAENVVRHSNGRVLVVTTLGDSGQALREARKFEVETVRSKDGQFPSASKIVITNYERLHYFTPNDFVGVVANESSILKNFKGKRKNILTEFMRTVPYRLLCTATAAPNDYIELGTSSEALGELGYQDMLTRFFVKHLADRGTIGWGREQFRMKGHAEKAFWQWVCSWARAVRKPSDLGFDDSQFILPELICNQHVVSAKRPRGGFLFDLPSITMEDQREELRRTLTERCEKAAELVSKSRCAITWCYLNPEGDLLTKLIPGAVQVSGANSDDEKEETYEAFENGQIRVLVSKPKVAGFGLNWQHCAHMTFFPSHSWEQWHQAIHRCWRFRQKNKVTVDVVTTEGMMSVLKNLQVKEDKVDRMFSRLVEFMNQGNSIKRSVERFCAMESPSWL